MSRRRILVVDHDVEITDSLRRFLEDTGRYEVKTVSQGAKSIDAARGFKPDLILIDFQMPDLDGSIVAAALKMDPVLGQIPIAFLVNAVAEEEIRRVGREIGGHPFVPKPVQGPELVAHVERLISSQETGDTLGQPLSPT